MLRKVILCLTISSWGSKSTTTVTLEKSFDFGIPLCSSEYWLCEFGISKFSCGLVESYGEKIVWIKYSMQISSNIHLVDALKKAYMVTKWNGSSEILK